MSLLEGIKSKRFKLSHTDTILKDVNGMTYMEDIHKGTMEVTSTGGLGYIVDTKPDFTVAQVLPGLLMGSQDVANSLPLLQEHGITHILSLGIHIPRLEGYNYIFVESLDLPEFSIIDIFDLCFEVIDSVRKQGKTIFVHCNAGVSRSASLVIAYLMKTSGMHLTAAHDFLKSLRPCIKPNAGFMEQLMLYEKSLKKK